MAVQTPAIRVMARILMVWVTAIFAATLPPDHASSQSMDDEAGESFSTVYDSDSDAAFANTGNQDAVPLDRQKMMEALTSGTSGVSRSELASSDLDNRPYQVASACDPMVYVTCQLKNQSEIIAVLTPLSGVDAVKKANKDKYGVGNILVQGIQ